MNHEMGRPRKDRRKDWPRYLYQDPRTRVFRVEFPGLPSRSLRTKDLDEAIAIRDELLPLWKTDHDHRQAELVRRSLVVPVAGTRQETFTDYCRRWREKRLPAMTRKNGKPMADKTRGDYARMIRLQVEPHESLQAPIGSIDATRLRGFLSQWLSSPAFYNYVLAVLSRVMESAVDDGILDRNPAKDVSRRATAARETYITHDHYALITSWDGWEDWQRKAVDLVYLMTHRPGTVLALKETDIEYVTVEGEDGRPIEALRIAFLAGKNKQPMEIWEPAGGDLDATVKWFRAWKRAQDLQSPYLVCYPRSMKMRRHIGREVSVEYLSRRYAQAVKAAGLGNEGYQLRDLRPKGWTDEITLAGKSEKLGDRTEEMEKRYDPRFLS